jgi:hypothetical protein
MLGLCVGDRKARADRQGDELIDRIAAGAPVRKLLFVEALGHTRVPFAGTGRITAPGSSWPQSTRIVQRKRRPTSNVDSMMVLRSRRGGTGSKYETLRGGVRRAIPFLVRSGGCARSSILCGQTATCPRSSTWFIVRQHRRGATQ